MKKILILVALLITVITISAKAQWVPCPDDENLTCTDWTSFQELKTFNLNEILGGPNCIITLTIHGYQRTCVDGDGHPHIEFYVEYFNYSNQPCLDDWLYDNDNLHMFNFSNLINYLADLKSLDMANTYFQDPALRSLNACAPNCIIGQTVLEITYSYPYCYGICYAFDQGVHYYKYTACSMYKCCVHKNRYCWNTSTASIQLCEGTNTEFDYGDPPVPCSLYATNCSPRGPWDTLNWVPIITQCFYHCQ